MDGTRGGMLTNPETSHLRKYLATLGVSIMLGSLGIGGFLLRNTNDLMVTTEQLTKLTPLAREAIEHRQSVSYTASIIAPYLILLGGLFGLTLTLFGLIGWARRQRVADRTEELELTRIEAEIRQLTDSERIQRAEQEAAQEALETTPSPSPAQPSGPSPGCAPAPGSGFPQSGAVSPEGNGQREPSDSASGYPANDYPYPEPSRSERAEKFLLAEYALGDKLAKGFERRHTERTARIDGSGRQRYADGLVMPTNQKDGYVIKLKVVSGDGGVRRTRRAQEQANELASMLEGSVAGGSFKPVAIVVHQDGPPNPIKTGHDEKTDGVTTLTFDFNTFLHTPGAELREMIEAS